MTSVASRGSDAASGAEGPVPPGMDRMMRFQAHGRRSSGSEPRFRSEMRPPSDQLWTLGTDLGARSLASGSTFARQDPPCANLGLVRMEYIGQVLGVIVNSGSGKADLNRCLSVSVYMQCGGRSLLARNRNDGVVRGRRVRSHLVGARTAAAPYWGHSAVGQLARLDGSTPMGGRRRLGYAER